MSEKTGEDKPAKKKDNIEPEIRSWFVSIGLEFASVVLSLALVWLAGLSLLMTRTSVDLEFVKPHYEHWFSQAFDGKTTEIDSYSARWIQEQGVVEILAKGVHILSADGTGQTIKDVRGKFRIKNNLFVTPEIVSLSINGGALTIVRGTDKSMQVSLGTPATLGNVAAIWQTDKVSDGGNLFGQIENITVTAADVYFQDKFNGLDVQFNDLSGSFSHNDGKVWMDAVGVLVMDDNNEAAFNLEIQTTPDLETLNVSLDVNNLVPARIAPKRGPVAILSRLEAPIDLNVIISTKRGVGVEKLQMNLIAGEGRLKTGPSYKPFTHARIAANYGASAKEIIIQMLEVESEALDIVASGHLDNPPSGVTGFFLQDIGFNIDIMSARLNPGSRFDGSVSVGSSQLAGVYNWDQQSVDFKTLALDFGAFKTDMSAGLKRDEVGNITNITADGNIKGTVNRKQLLNFWPKDFVIGARDWVANSLRSGNIKNIKIYAVLDAQDIKSKKIANDHLKVQFDVSNVVVLYMRKMPRLRNGSGYGVLRGNMLNFYISKGNVDELRLNSGKVTIPRLSPNGGDFTIDLQVSGSASEMLRISNFPPFEFPNKYGLNPATFDGVGIIDLHITRPLLVEFDPRRVLYELSGQFTGVGIPVGIGSQKLNDGTISLQADKRVITISGPIKLGKWQTTLDWRKPLEFQDTPARYTLIGKVTRDDLDVFGIGLRRHFGGEIGLHISGEWDGLSVKQADVFANFKQADINIGSLWYKPKDVDGKLVGRLILDPGGGGRIENLEIISEGLEIKGAVALAQNFQLISLNLPTTKIAGLVDAKISARPKGNGVLSVGVDGSYLNVEPWVSKAFKTQSSSVALPIDLTAKLTQLVLGENYALADANIRFSHTGQKISNARLSGLRPGGVFLAEITSRSDASMRNVRIEIPDASVAMLHFLGLGNIEGGILKLDGKLPPASKQGGLSGKMSLQKFTLIRAPAFTQILSLASLQGLSDTLSGGGLKFNEMEMQFALKDGVLKIREGRASGPALGLTGEGDIGITSRTVDFNGVLVPSYTVNSILGDIPVLGDILVGKKGEGVFALNYSVKGPFAKTQIAVNPLSALTPGFLRRIFDVKRDKITDPKITDLIKEQKKKGE
ncbi:MAG: DUF3971 domain-containing protein [Robiginitomaculum sp.]|nr:DUF3971 domain-containing protein [Robiginitomaculum sp.]